MHLLPFLCAIFFCSLPGIKPYNVERLSGSKNIEKRAVDIWKVQTDSDVDELETLKHNHGLESSKDYPNDDILTINDTKDEQKDVILKATVVDDSVVQLEELATNSDKITEERKTTTTTVATELQNGQNVEKNNLQTPNGNTRQVTNVEVEKVPVPTNIKPFYGAARLAFGQKPEAMPTILSPTSLTTTTTSTSAVTITRVNQENVEEPEKSILNKFLASSTTAPETEILKKKENDEQPVDEPPQLKPEEQTTKELLSDSLVQQLSAVKSSSRRSSAPTIPKIMFRAQYSPFDIAQYIYWTGDESGIARAIEELVEKDILLREDALKLLRDIRLEIDDLEKTYENHLYSKQSTPVLLNMQYSIRSRTKSLQEMNDNLKNKRINNTNRFGKQEFIFTENKLEEILYKLAKIMFEKSLTHGDEAQKELQKLTDFLEREGNLGVIPINLQKKVLDVLYAALSDTLKEHPELINSAHLNFANRYDSNPINTYEPTI